MKTCPACEEKEVASNCMGLCEDCYNEFVTDYNEHLSREAEDYLRLKVSGEIHP